MGLHLVGVKGLGFRLEFRVRDLVGLDLFGVLALEAFTCLQLLVQGMLPFLFRV